MLILKLVEIGTESGVILPREVLERLNARQGDFLEISPTAEGYLLRRCDPEVASQVTAGGAFMNTYEGAFRTLAE